jgi:hypothetical protein
MFFSVFNLHPICLDSRDIAVTEIVYFLQANVSDKFFLVWLPSENMALDLMLYNKYLLYCYRFVEENSFKTMSTMDWQSVYEQV